MNRCWLLAVDDDLSQSVVSMKDNRATDVFTILKAATIIRH